MSDLDICNHELPCDKNLDDLIQAKHAVEAIRDLVLAVKVKFKYFQSHEFHFGGTRSYWP